MRGSPVGALGCILASALAVGCVAAPVATPGGRARVGIAGAFGDTAGDDAALVPMHVGVTPLSLVPEIFEADFELGYVADLFLSDGGQRSGHGAYVGGSYTPLLHRGSSGTYLRGVVQLDADLMSRRGLALGGATASVGVELFGYITGQGVIGDLRGGVAGVMAGQWSVGVQLTGSYRYAETGEQYGFLGATLSIRFPAAVGSVYATALLAIDLAASENGNGASGPVGDMTSGETRSRSMDGRDAPPPPPPRWICEDARGNRGEGMTRLEARRLCASEDCACRRGDLGRPPAPR